jgi:FG-GAP-like repeat/FG-GAP repeat
MKKRRNNSNRASTLQIALSTGLISISAILLAIAVPANRKEAPRQDLYGFQLEKGADAITALGNYPNTSVLLSTDKTVMPDAAPTNTTSINVSTSTNFKGTFAASSTTGVVTVTDAHPAGTYTVTVRAFGGGTSVTQTFMLTVTTPPTCAAVRFAGPTIFSTFAPLSVAVGDFNGDGKQDLAVAGNGSSNNVAIFLGNGAGSFGVATNFSAGVFPSSLVVGDFNGDGKQDLAVVNTGSGNNDSSVSILLGDGAGSFSAATNYPLGGRKAAVGDFNGDGIQDLAVTTSSDSVAILLGNGAGGFGAPTNFPTYSPDGIAVGDFNGDGKQDLAVTTSGGGVAILLGNGAGGFGAPTNFAADSPNGVAVGDFNGDGKQDLAVTDFFNRKVSILLGDGNGHFSTPSSYSTPNTPGVVVVGDFNGDGNQDLAVVNGLISIFLGNGAGSFSAAINFSVGNPYPGPNPLDVAVGDFNGDGKQDLVTANNNAGNVAILLRDCALTPATLGNISTRLQVGTSDRVMIAGFIVQGSAPKRVLIRAAGPSLTQFGVPNALANPRLELHDASNTIGMNDDWQTTQIGGVITSDQVTEIQSSGLAPRDPAESAVIVTLAPGSYTAIVQGVNGGTGVGIVEVYDLNATSGSLLANISTRGFVQSGDNAMIGGFIVVTQPTRVIIRAIGPSLTPFGVPDALANPQLELHDASSSLIAQNNDWQTTQIGGIITSDQVAEIQNSQLAPTNPMESAITATLQPGSYTAIMRGVNNTTGNALVEVYALQ